MSNEIFLCTNIANRSVSAKLIWMNNSKIRLKFKGSCSKQENKAPLTPNNVAKLFIVYAVDRWPWDLNIDFTLKDSLFGAIKLTKNADREKYKYSDYGIGFDSRSEFSLSDGSMGEMLLFLELIWEHLCILIIRIKDILILGRVPAEGLDDITSSVKLNIQLIFQNHKESFV